MSMAAVVGVGVASATVVACGSATDSEAQLALTNDPLQIAWVGINEGSTGFGVNLLKANSQSRVGKSTGAVRIDKKVGIDGTRGTCGVTFISHKYAVTASHCVVDYLPSTGTGTDNGQSFIVEQFNTTSLDLNRVVAQSDVIGPWPTYSRPTKMVNGQNGYSVSSWTCRVERRCGSIYSPSRCPAGVGDVDISLIRCTARTNSGLNWVPVLGATGSSFPLNTGDTIPGNVEVWWFHELVDLATGPVAYVEPYQPNFNWEVYGKYPGETNLPNNYHYYQTPAAERQQLFPLRSRLSAAGVQYVSNTVNSGDPVTWTNVPVCHGTSGSGVFRANSNGTPPTELLGVVDLGVLQIGGEQALCANMSVSPGNQGMGYSRLQHTRVFGNLSEVTGDRI